jgi:hypothetical protein
VYEGKEEFVNLTEDGRLKIFDFRTRNYIIWLGNSAMYLGICADKTIASPSRFTKTSFAYRKAS